MRKLQFHHMNSAFYVLITLYSHLMINSQSVASLLTVQKGLDCNYADRLIQVVLYIILIYQRCQRKCGTLSKSMQWNGCQYF